MPCRYEYGRYLPAQKEDYKDGIIAYERAKTKNARNDNAYIEMRVPGILLPIFDKYMDKTSSPYLLIFISACQQVTVSTLMLMSEYVRFARNR